MHPFFEKLKPTQLTSENFDSKLFKMDGRLKLVFMWGHDCPNCEVAKNVLVDRIAELRTDEMDWFEINVYENMEISSRFGLHGIPVFFFFRDGKNLGKCTTFPGWEPFSEILDKMASKT